MKDAVEDVAEDVTRDVAEDVLGAEEDGPSSVSGGKIIITPVAYPQLPPPPRPKRFLHQRFLHRRAKRSLNVRSSLLVQQAQWQWRSARSTRAHAPFPTPPPAAAAIFVQLAQRWGCNWAAQWHLARAVGKTLPGVPRKALLC